MTEPQRKHPAAKCEECPLRVGGIYVGSSGPEKAEIAFVGEAPGVQEARVGKPFVGPSGQLLNVVLNHHGVERSEVFLSNACLCRPADGSTPPKAAIQCCRQRLGSELMARGVEKVVALGNSAAESLLGQSGITSLRVGPPRRSRIFPNLEVIPTIHPAAALRVADQFPYIVRDIGKLNYVAPEWADPQYVVAVDGDEALVLLGQLESRKPEALVIDIEVDVEKDTAFDHPNRYGMLCVGIGYAAGKVLVLGEGAMQDGRVRDRMGNLLRATKLVAQNGKFDLAGLYPVVGKLQLWFDTMLASYVFDERGGIHGLKVQAKEFLGAPDYESDIRRYVGPGVGYGAIPRDKLYRYNAIDVACTYALWQMYEQRFVAAGAEGEQLRGVHDFLVAASNQLMFVELNGIGVDTDALIEVEEEMTERLSVIEEEMNNIIAPRNYDKRGGINPRSWKQIQEFLADMKVKTDSTDEEHIKAILERPNLNETVQKFCNALLIHRKEAKLYGTYIKGTRKRLYRGRVYPTFLLHGTTTGRLSCRNPNLQNVPRGSAIRKLFVPTKPGNVFVQTDYSQAELRVLSYLAGDRYFRDIFNACERDIFDDLTPRIYPGASKHDMDPGAWKELRVRVKAFVYGLAYGRTAEGLAAEYDMTLREAYEARDNFFSTIPEIVSFLQKVRSDVRAGKDLVTPFGRHRRFMLLTKENANDVMNQAQAFLPQSTASDMCLTAMTRVRQDLIGIGYVRNIVHDSILVECSEEDAEEVQGILERRMLEAFDDICQGYVVGAVDSKTGKSWGEV